MTVGGLSGTAIITMRIMETMVQATQATLEDVQTMTQISETGLESIVILQSYLFCCSLWTFDD